MRYILAILTSALLVGCFQDCSSMTPEGDLDGRINTNSGHCDYNHGNLLVNSGGGNISDAINIANYISAADGKVTVNGQCSSACVLLLASASSRAICSGGWIGLHQGDSDRATNRMIDHLASDDRMNIYMIEYMIRITPYNDIYRLSPYDALWYGLVDEIVTCI